MSLVIRQLCWSLLLLPWSRSNVYFRFTKIHENHHDTMCMKCNHKTGKYVYKSQKPETWPWGAGLSLEHAQLETEATHNAPVKKQRKASNQHNHSPHESLITSLGLWPVPLPENETQTGGSTVWLAGGGRASVTERRVQEYTAGLQETVQSCSRRSPWVWEWTNLHQLCFYGCFLLDLLITAGRFLSPRGIISQLTPARTRWCAA